MGDHISKPSKVSKVLRIKRCPEKSLYLTRDKTAKQTIAIKGTKGYSSWPQNGVTIKFSRILFFPTWHSFPPVIQNSAQMPVPREGFPISWLKCSHSGFSGPSLKAIYYCYLHAFRGEWTWNVMLGVDAGVRQFRLELPAACYLWHLAWLSCASVPHLCEDWLELCVQTV